MTVKISQRPQSVNNDIVEPTLIQPGNLQTQGFNGPFTYIVQTTPSHGRLEVNEVPATPGTMFTQDDIDAGNVTYQYGGGNFSQDSFAFAVQDSTGTTPPNLFQMQIFAAWDPVAIGNFNQSDGTTDIMWQTFATTAAGGPLLSGTSEWLMSSTGGAGAQLTMPSAPAPWFLPHGALATELGDPLGRQVNAGAGDFNRDGFTDLLWVNQSTGATSEWLGTASGTFAPSVGVPGYGPTSPVNGWTLLGQGDFNGDGTPDLVWHNLSNNRADPQAGSISVWLGQKGGVLTALPLTNKAFSDEWQLVAQDDFNGDGISDLIWRGIDNGQISEYLGSASGEFKPVDPKLGTEGWTLGAAGDFNGDGIADLLWINNTGTNGELGSTSLWLGGPNGGFGVAAGTPSVTGYALAGQGDFNGDGRTDLVWFSPLTGHAGEWLGTPNGGFSFPATPNVEGLYPAAEGDFNGDGIADLLWVDVLFGQTSEWLGAKSGGFTELLNVTPPAPPLPSSGGWFVATQGNFNNDATTDLLWLSVQTGATSEWLMAPGGGVLAIPNTPPAAASGTLPASSALHANDFLLV